MIKEDPLVIPVWLSPGMRVLKDKEYLEGFQNSNGLKAHADGKSDEEYIRKCLADTKTMKEIKQAIFDKHVSGISGFVLILYFSTLQRFL